MQIDNTANRISISADTGGWPIRVRLFVDGDEVPNTLSPSDLHDLIYVAQRTLAAEADIAASRQRLKDRS